MLEWLKDRKKTKLSLMHSLAHGLVKEVSKMLKIEPQYLEYHYQETEGSVFILDNLKLGVLNRISRNMSHLLLNLGLSLEHCDCKTGVCTKCLSLPNCIHDFDLSRRKTRSFLKHMGFQKSSFGDIIPPKHNKSKTLHFYLKDNLESEDI